VAGAFSQALLLRPGVLASRQPLRRGLGFALEPIGAAPRGPGGRGCAIDHHRNNACWFVIGFAI
jgi:hypothetical protein